MPRKNNASKASPNQIRTMMNNAFHNFLKDVNLAAEKHFNFKNFVSKGFAVDVTAIEDDLVQENCDNATQKEEGFNNNRRGRSEILTLIKSDSEDKKTSCNVSQKSLSVNRLPSDSDDGKHPMQKKQRNRKRVFDYDPYHTVSTQYSSDSDLSWEERPMPSPRKKIKTAGSENDSDYEHDSSYRISRQSRRKNIRPVLEDYQLTARTKQAANIEKERLKRIAERQKMYDEIYEIPVAGAAKIDKFVLDFDEESKEPLVSVEESLVKRLQPHQAEVIKFMWDACFESLERVKSTQGSGCIIANCLDPDKSLLVMALSHTLFSNPETGVKTVLLLCPHKAILNWINKFKSGLFSIEAADKIHVYEMMQMKTDSEKQSELMRWQATGGVMVISYVMFRSITKQSAGKKVLTNTHKSFLECLVDPGPNLLVCDKGRLLNNKSVSDIVTLVKTLRRVVLTATPLRDHLLEYYSMMQFIKPNLLGTKKEFRSRFVHPITNGQFDDSTDNDIELMNKQISILHKLLEGSVKFAIDRHSQC